MPRKPKQFRLSQEEIAKLDWLCAQLAPGVPLNQTQVLRVLIEGEYARRGGPRLPSQASSAGNQRAQQE